MEYLRKVVRTNKEPDEKEVLWVDTAHPDYPVMKYYENGNWKLIRQREDGVAYIMPYGGIPYSDLSQEVKMAIASGGAQANWNQTNSASPDFIWNKPYIPTALADLTEDSSHKFVSATEKTSWNAKYERPSTGIPSTDLASAVQASLDKADSAYQKPSGGIPKADLVQVVQDSLGKADGALQGIIYDENSYGAQPEPWMSLARYIATEYTKPGIYYYEFQGYHLSDDDQVGNYDNEVYTFVFDDGPESFMSNPPLVFVSDYYYTTFYAYRFQKTGYGNNTKYSLIRYADEDWVNTQGFYKKPVTGIPAADIANGVIPDVSGFVTKSGDIMDVGASLVFGTSANPSLSNTTDISGGIVKLKGSEELAVVLDGPDGAVMVSSYSGEITADTPRTEYKDGSILKKTSGGSYTLTIPSSTGTIALTSNIPDISGKADAATTLAGYGITDAYTKTETDAKLSAVYKPAGNVDFINQLGALTAENLGKVYNVLNGFTTTSNFMEGSGKKYPAGTNVVIVQTGSSQNPTYKYDVLAGFVDLSPYAVKSVVNAELDKKQSYSCGMSFPSNQKEGDVFELLQELETVSNSDYNEIVLPASDSRPDPQTMCYALQLDVPEGASGVICTSLVAQFDRWYEVFNLTTEEVIELDGNIWTQNVVCDFPNDEVGSTFAKLPAGCTSLVLADDFGNMPDLDLTEISITFAGNPTLYQYTNGSWVKCLTESERTAWNAKYTKPASGVPASDLAQLVRNSLAKANSSLQIFDSYEVDFDDSEFDYPSLADYILRLDGRGVFVFYCSGSLPLSDGGNAIEWNDAAVCVIKLDDDDYSGTDGTSLILISQDRSNFEAYRLKTVISPRYNYSFSLVKYADQDWVTALGYYTKPSGGIPAADIASGVIPDAVEANPAVPQGTTPTALTGLKIGNSYYSAPSVVALTNNEIDTIWTNAS